MSRYANLLLPGPYRGEQIKLVEHYPIVTYTNGQLAKVAFITGKYFTLVDIVNRTLICTPLKVEEKEQQILSTTAASAAQCSALVMSNGRFAGVKTQMKRTDFDQVVDILKQHFRQLNVPGGFRDLGFVSLPAQPPNYPSEYYETTDGQIRIQYRTKRKWALVEHFEIVYDPRATPPVLGPLVQEVTGQELKIKLKNTLMLFQDMMRSHLRTEFACDMP